MSSVLTIDKDKVQQSFASAADSYDELAALQRKVGKKLLQQFTENNVADVIVDIGCGTGFLTQQLIAKGWGQQIIALDIALSMVQKTKIKLASSPHVQYICADAESIPTQNHVVNTIVSNLALQWCQNLNSVFTGFSHALKPEGRLLFSTFGPSTLKELKQAWAEVDNFTHVNEFYSADEIHIFLTQAGFTEIKITTQSYQSQYASVIELMRELKGIGAHNVLSRRNRQTTRKTNMQAMISTYEKYRTAEGIPATYEIYFVSAIVK